MSKSSPNSKNGQGRCSWMCCCRAFVIIFTILGLILAAIGVFLVLRYRSIFTGILSSKMPLSESSSTFASFKNPPADIYMSFRFFNLTNPAEVMKGARPILKEIGPYVYKNKREKENIHFNDEGTEVFYEEKKFYVFDTEKSVGTENDTFTSLDLVGYSVIKAADAEGKLPYLAKTLTVTKRFNPFKEHRVKEFLFGAKDLLLEKVLPLKFPDEKTRPPPVFGMLVEKATGESKNGRIDGNYTLNTGKADFKAFQQIVKYNDMSRLDNVWPVANITDPVTGEPVDANVIRGTLGTGFAPGVRKESVLNAFAADLCLTIGFTYNTATKTGPIDTMRFTIDVANWRKFVGQLNRAMCAPEDRNDPTKCMQDGVLNATTCKGAALMMSLPHLMQADAFYQNTTLGLTPDEAKHSIFLDIDPLTGAALNVAKRMQVNIRLTPVKFRNYTTLPPFTLLPIMWIEESGGVNPDGLVGLKEKVHSSYNMLKNIAYALLIMGIALLPITIVIFLVFKQRYTAKQSEEVVQMSQVRTQEKSGQNQYAPSGFVAPKRPGEGHEEEKRPLK